MLWATIGAAVAVNPVTLRVVSYNIRHGEGNDGKISISRTADLLKGLKPDIVGLQEVDQRVERTGGVAQAEELGKLTKMNWAFGSFMEYQGGEYGMGALSRFKILEKEAIRLPEGNEPRVALKIVAELPGGEKLTVVTVHFDWVDDDAFRFAQAEYLADRLKKLKGPWVLLGDFNDEPGSRTIQLFQGMAKEAKKPEGDRFTFSSDKPEKEIDFVFVWPPERWDVKSVRVVDEKVVSDHRPVVADLVLRP